MKLLKTLALIVFSLLLAAVGAADEPSKPKSTGEAIGGTVRQIVDDSKAIFKETKKTVVQTGKQIAEEAKETYKKTKQAGGRTAEDIREGYQKGAEPKDKAD